MRRGFQRIPVPAQAQPPAQTARFRSPVRGWVSNVSLAAGLKDAAIVMDNWFPTATGVRLRGGSEEYVDLGSNPITFMFTYSASGVEKLFACETAKVWNITSTANADITGQTSGDYSWQQMETAGGNYGYLCNGADSPQLYDGSSWAAVTGASSIAITGVTTTGLSHPWVYRNRLYFVEKDTQQAWYLPLDSVGGSATVHTLRGVFQNGGSLLMGATWSTDAGDGADDYNVFVSDQGEVAVYTGDDPGADNWSLVGRYDLGGKPLGKNATMRAGGDLLIATMQGIVPLSQVLQKDPAALKLSAVTVQIEPDWINEADRRQTRNWHMVKWVEKNMGFVALPVVDGTTDPMAYVINLQTGAWARYTGWDTRSCATYRGGLYFGTSDGRVMIAESGGNDDGEVYVCSVAWHFDDLRRPAQFKTAVQARATFRAAKAFNPQLSMSVDYAQSFPAAPDSVANFTVDEWGSAIWGTAVWGAQTTQATVSTMWKSVTGAGFTHAPQVQVTCGTTPVPDAEMMSLDLLYRGGGVVV